MEPNMMGNMQTPSPVAPGPVGTEQVVAEQVTVAQTEPAPVFKDEKKGGKGMLFGLILCLLLAAGGIGFGVWAMMGRNSRAESLELQIANLKSQNANLLEQITELNEKIESLEGGKDQYLIIEELGIKIKKSSDLPNMVVEYQDNGGLIIKENQDASGLPSQVSLMKATTCNDEELTLGYGAKIDLGGTCYLVSEILPYGLEDDYPLTDFLKYVITPENYSAI